MGLFKRYRPNPPGIRAIAQSPKVGDACLDAGRKVASWANADDPDGHYEAQPTVVTAGWNNEARRGARVVETVQGRGGERRTLVRSVNGGSGTQWYTTKSGKRRRASAAQIAHWSRGK